MTTVAPPVDIAANLAHVQARIEQVSREAGRPGGTQLIAVSKTMPAAAVQAALGVGQTVFGENRVQEAQGKFPALKAAHPELKLHLIGPLQSNKARDAVKLFDVIQTVDRPSLAEALAKEMAKLGRRPDCLVEVNTGKEPQKAGVLPEDTDAFIRQVREKWGLPLIGLMCIPPADEEPALHFALLREIAQRNGLQVLSMGMSADYETAIHFGATHVRVGSAIFGARH
jgi:PLP dependent protein